MKYTKKVLSVLMAAMMGFSLMTTPIQAEQEPAGEEPEVTEEQKTEEPEAAPEEEIKEPEAAVSEVSEETEGEQEVAEGQEEGQPEEQPEVKEETEKTEEPEVVEDEQEEPEETEDPVIDSATYNDITVTVSYSSDAFGGKNVTLVVGDAGETEKEALKEFGKEYKAVDISFVGEDGEKVQPEKGSQVSVSLKVEDMKKTGDFEVVHVDGKGIITPVAAKIETSNEVTEKVKVGETTKTVEVPAETETVTVKDYKTEKYTTYETKTKKVKVPTQYGYRYYLKYKKNGKKVKASVANPILKKAKKDKSGKPIVKNKKYKVAKEKYVVKKAYTKTVTEKVPVTKTRKVQSGTHKETKVIKEAYSYEKKEDVYEDVTRSDVSSAFEAESFSVYATVSSSIESGEKYVIYTRGGNGTYYALRNDNVGFVAITVNGNNIVSSDNNIVWTVTASGNGYTFENGNDQYLRRERNNNNTVQIGANTNNVWSYANNRLSCTVNNNTRYLRRNNGTVNVDESINNASNFYFAKVDRITGPALTIHLGTLSHTQNNNSFTEFSNITSSYSTDDFDLDKFIFRDQFPVEGYTLIGGRYSATASTDSNVLTEFQSNSELGDIRLVNDNWQTDEIYLHGNVPDTRVSNIAPGSHIYLFYEKDGTDGYEPPTVPGQTVDPKDTKPEFEKTVEEINGTYKIRLDITGKQASAQAGQGANVIVVIDTTKSMRYSMEGSDPGSWNASSTNTRMYAAKQALFELTNVLKPGSGAPGSGTNLVNMAFIEFNNSSTTHSWGGGQQWTNNRDAIDTYISGLQPVGNNQSGTNWETGLKACDTLLGQIENNPDLNNNVTYVIFVTDGDPNKCDEYNINDFIHNAQAAAHAQDDANSLATKSYLYGVFCGKDAGADRLDTLINAAKGEDAISAGSMDELKDAFTGIGQIILQGIGSHDVSADDGIPKLANIQHTVSGEATDFTYYKNNEPWTGSDVPQAEYDPENGVVWDLSSLDTLDKGTVYSVEFTIWPSQYSYDLIADLL